MISWFAHRTIVCVTIVCVANFQRYIQLPWFVLSSDMLFLEKIIGSNEAPSRDS